MPWPFRSVWLKIYIRGLLETWQPQHVATFTLTKYYLQMWKVYRKNGLLGLTSSFLYIWENRITTKVDSLDKIGKTEKFKCSRGQHQARQDQRVHLKIEICLELDTVCCQLSLFNVKIIPFVHLETKQPNCRKELKMKSLNMRNECIRNNLLKVCMKQK